MTQTRGRGPGHARPARGSGPARRHGRRPSRPARLGVAHPARRVRFLLLTVLFVFSLFGAQLLRLQALDASTMARAALKSRLSVVVLPGMRGDIIDANGVVLATSLERRNVTADQSAVPEYKKKGRKVGVAGAAADLAPILGKPVAELIPTLTGSRRFVYVAKLITPLSWRQIQALEILGVFS